MPDTTERMPRKGSPGRPRTLPGTAPGVQLGIKITPGTKRRLDLLAAASGRSKGALVEEAIGLLCERYPLDLATLMGDGTEP